MTTRWAVLLVALLVGCLGVTDASAQSNGHVMVSPADLKWVDVPALPPGARMAIIQGPPTQAAPFTFRLKFPADYRIPAHSHPAIEHVTVLTGTLHMSAGDRLDQTKTHPLPAGSVAIMPARVNHFGWTREETIVQVHGVGPWGVTWVNPADDPLRK